MKTAPSRKNMRRQPGLKKTVQTAGVLRQIPLVIHCMQEEMITIKFSEVAGGYFSPVNRLAGRLNPRI
jgi:hypothetical protein